MRRKTTTPSWFAYTQKAEFLEFRSAIESAVAKHQAPFSPVAQATSPMDQAANLPQLKELHESGLLTDEEYEAKRFAVLESL
jgi:Short C-terminal domain